MYYTLMAKSPICIGKINKEKRKLNVLYEQIDNNKVYVFIDSLLSLN